MKHFKLYNRALLLGVGLGIGLTTAQANVILNGDYLRVGVNTSGGLIDDNFVVGIDYDETGTSTWTSYDFVKPGTPYEFFSVGYNGSYQSSGYNDGNNFAATTVNTSAGSTLSTLTTGNYDLLGISQVLSFNQGSGTIAFSVTLTNTGASALNNVAYARGLDPDQDVFANGGYETTNSVINSNLVVASAPITDWTIGIFTDSSYAHTPTVRSSWPFGDPYELLNPLNDGNGDNSINMAWNIGTIEAGASAVINFEYRIAETRDEVVTPPAPGVPDSGATVGLLGLAMAALIGVRRRFVRVA